jgi:anaerobic selenocysteine-containing dehydrogenase
VLAELAELAAEPQAAVDIEAPMQLIVRRMRDVNGSMGLHSAAIRRRNPTNPLHMNPADLASLGLRAGQKIRVRAQHGAIVGIVQADPTLREGVVSMSHNWGRADNHAADAQHGASTNRLVDARRLVEAINAMPRMSAVPIAIEGI